MTNEHEASHGFYAYPLFIPFIYAFAFSKALGMGLSAGLAMNVYAMKDTTSAQLQLDTLCCKIC